MAKLYDGPQNLFLHIFIQLFGMGNNFEQLFEKFLRDDLAPGELKILLRSVKDQRNADAIQSVLKARLELPFEPVKHEPASLYMKEKFRQMLLKAEEIKRRELEGKLIEMPARGKYFTIGRIAVAAAIVLILGVGGYLLFFQGGRKTREIVNVATSDVKAPGTNRAMITLANGSTVYLDSAGNGQLALQGNIQLVKLGDGQIAYEALANTSANEELAYNTLSNPRGSKVIDMVLSDGSHVWLNAGSSLTYPVVFAGKERQVTVTGEAYFEIAHNSKKPFKVSKGAVTVEVLGTRFNVNAYDDEADIKVTLLEGSVKVTSDQGTLTIKPDQQAIVTNSGVLLNGNVEMEAVMAWKEGRFVFSGDNIYAVMRQLSRWYDVEVSYSGSIPAEEFVGVISRDRNENISSVLSVLEMTKTVRFNVNGRNVTVMPAR